MLSLRLAVFSLTAALCSAQSTAWESLFDGLTPAGWRTQSRDAFPANAWKIEDGCLRSIASAPRVDLSTARRFRNFELEFEWKLAPKTNSGVKYLVFGMRPNPATGKIDPDVPKALGFELQLVDDTSDPDAKLAPSHSTGALYLFVAPHDVPKLAVGEWHRAKVRVDGRRLEHWLDGVRVMEADLESESLRAAMADQSRADIPKPHHLDELRADPAKAYPIVLTHHGGDAWYRNLRVRQLAPARAAAPAGRVPRDPASVEAGRQIYLGSCSGCHGATGEGSQGPSLLSGRASRLPDRTLVSSIRNGLPGTSMPNFPMADEKILQVAAFVRSLTSPAIAAQVPGDAARGRQLFFGSAGCSGCHMILGRGGHPGPDLSNIGAERTVPQLRESLLKPSARIAEGYRGVTAVLASGAVIRGVARNHNNYSVEILDRAGKLHLLEQGRIAKLEFMDASIMPAVADAGLERDLIAFLARQSVRQEKEDSK